MFEKSMIASLVLGLALVGAPAKTEAAAGKLVDCAKVDGPMERLACYDKTMKNILTGGERPQGNWQVNVEGKNVYMSIASSEIMVRSVQMSGKAKLLHLRPTLWLQCEDNKTSGYIDWGIFIDDGGLAEIKSAFDNQPYGKAELAISKDFKRTGTWDAGRVIGFMKEGADKSLFRVQVTPYSEKPITAQFRIQGMGDAMKPLREACGW